MNVQRYFARIGLSYDALPAPSLQLLTAIQRAHTLTIPFENLAMHGDEEPLTADELYSWGLNETSTQHLFASRLFDKLVLRNRGGFCFEQNVLLFQALVALGFRASLARAWVNGSLRGQPIVYRAVATHVLVRVELEEGVFFVDCGLGPSPLTPLPELGELAEFANDGDAAPRRHWRLLRFDSAASFGLPVAGSMISVSFREASAELWYARIAIVTQPWTFEAVRDGLHFTYNGATSWFRNTVIAIRSSPTTLFVLQNEALVETEMATGESVKRHVPLAELPRVLSDEFKLDAPPTLHLPLPIETQI